MLGRDEVLNMLCLETYIIRLTDSFIGLHFLHCRIHTCNTHAPVVATVSTPSFAQRRSGSSFSTTSSASLPKTSVASPPALPVHVSHRCEVGQEAFSVWLCFTFPLILALSLSLSLSFSPSAMTYRVLVVGEGKHFGLSTASLYVTLAGELGETVAMEIPRGEYQRDIMVSGGGLVGRERERERERESGREGVRMCVCVC